MRSFWLLGAACAAISMPLASTAHGETLAEALALAYHNAPVLRAERAALDATNEGYVQARAGYLPSVSASASIGRSRSDDGSSVDELDPKTASLTATQPLFRGGQTRAGVDVAKAQIDAGRANLRSVEQTVFLNVVSAYMDVIRDQKALAIRRSNIEALRKQLDAADIRFKVGEITKTDVAQAQARLSAARAAASGAEAALASSRARYKELVGQAPGTLEVPANRADIPSDMDAALQQAWANTPQVEAADAGVAIARKSVVIARAQGLPRLSLQASASRAEDSIAAGSERDSTAITAVASMPLYAGGSISSGVRAALANENRARIQLDQTRRSVESQLVASWTGLEAARMSLEASQAQEQAAAFAYDGVQQEAEVGLRTTLDVLDAQQEYLSAQLAVVSAERDVLVSQHTVLAATGQLSATTLGLDPAVYDAAARLKATRRQIGR